jgi:hypothetical protein
VSEELAKLVVSMEAQAAKYIKDLKKSQKQTAVWKNQAVKHAEQVQNTFNKLTIAAAVTAGSVALKGMINNATRLATETKKLSRLAGLSTTEFQRQAYAFETVGFQADKFADVTKDVQEKVGLFLRGAGGPFKEFMDELGYKAGLTNAALTAMSGTDVLIAVKKAMDDANVSAKQQVSYMEDLASDATILLPLLSKEGKAIRDLTAEYDALGIGMSEADISELAAIAKENRKLEKSFDDMQAKLTTSIGPAILRFFETLTSGITHLVKVTKWAGEEMAAYFNGPAFDDIVRINEQLTNALQEQKKWQDLLASGADGDKQKGGGKTINGALERVKIEIAKLEALKDIYESTHNQPSKPLEIGITNGNFGETPDQKAAKDKTALDDFLKLQERLLSEEEAEKLSYNRRNATIDEALKREQISRVEAYKERQRVQQEYDNWELSKEKELYDAKVKVAEGALDIGIAIAKDGSKAERAMLAVKKAILLKESLMSLQAAGAKALNLPPPSNFIAMGQVALQGAGIISNLKGISTDVPSFLGGGVIPDGPRTGGPDGFGGIPALVHPGETIIDPKNPDSAMGGVEVNVHNYSGQNVDVITEGKVVDIVVGQMGNQSSRGRNALHATSNVLPKGRM